MAPAASPPPALSASTDYDQVNDDLDDEIKSVRAESAHAFNPYPILLTSVVQALTQRRKLLSSALLKSTAIQHHLKTQSLSASSDLPEDITPLLANSQNHAESNLHRLAYGVTAFPFTDPNPETSSKRLLGIRIDICGREGKFGKPYYILCKRVDDHSNEMRIHRHTIPVFIPLNDYEEQYLPLHDEGYGSQQSTNGPPSVVQDLHALVQKVRHDLVSWRRRTEAVDLMRDELGLSATRDEDVELGGDDNSSSTSREHDREGSFGVRSVSAVSVEARQAKIVWTDGRVGRVKISDEGMIERAVVIGAEGRVRNAERILCEGVVGIQDLADKLEILYQQAERISENE